MAAKVTPKIINLSGHQLNFNEISVLSKCTKFCPTPISFNTMVEKNDVNNFCRKLKLAEFFYDCGDSNNDESLVIPKSSFTPPSGSLRLDCLDLIHYFYNSKTRCDRQKQIAFLKSALKSTLIKKEK